jgi:protein phosphatase
LPLRAGDRFLVCSDGLTDLVTDAEIQTILATHPPEAATQTFVDLARVRGGHDNITVISALVPPPRLRRPVLLGFLLTLALMLVLVAAGSLGLLWFGLWPW